MRLQVGQRVLHFVLERKLGEGGFGEVWLARAGRAATALKFVSVAGGDRDRGGKEYRRINMMIETGAFNHDRLIKLHGAWLLDEGGEEIPDGVLESAVHARTMELPDQMVEPDTLLVQMDLGQESLAAMLKRLRKGLPEDSPGGIPLEELLRYIHEAAEGIDYLNTPRTGYDGQTRQAVYHCDIKPENLLLADGKVRICDYGVARIEGERKTKSPNALSLAHASPELVEDKPCAQSDQYSLAVTYAQLRTGHLPFKSEVLNGSWRTVMRAVAAGELDLSGLESKERAVIKRATSLNPKKRYASATEMARELSRVTGHTAPGTGPIPTPTWRIPWKTFAAVGVAASLLGAGAYYRNELQALFNDNKTTPVVTDSSFQKAQAAFLDKAENGNVDLAEFDALAKLAVAEDQGLDAEVLAALETGTSQQLQKSFTAMDEADGDPLTGEAMAGVHRDRERIEKHLQGEQRDRLLNRFRLLEARQKLRVDWPDASVPPTERLVLFGKQDQDLEQGPVNLAGFAGNDQFNLLALRALNHRPTDPAELPSAEVGQQFAVAITSAASAAEKARLNASVEQMKAAVAQHIADSGIDDAIAAERDTWNALKIDPVGLCMAGADAKFKAGEDGDAERLFASIEKYIQGGPGENAEQAQARINWCRAIMSLGSGEEAKSLEELNKQIDDVPPDELNRLAEGLSNRFSRPLPAFDGKQESAQAELDLLTAAINLCDRIESSKMSENIAVARNRLVAQRMLVRLLLPEGQDNGWKPWVADAKTVDEAKKQSAPFTEQLKQAGLAESVGLCLFEYNATQSDGGPKAPASAVKALAANTASLPGYAAYVALIATDAGAGTSEAAGALAKLYENPQSSASSAHLPGLDWAERRRLSAKVLVDAAAALRETDPNDISAVALTPEKAAECLKFLDLAQKLSGEGTSANTNSLALLAKYFAATTSPPPALRSDVEKRLTADPSRKDPNAAWLLLISARLHQAAGDHEFAVKRFAEALARYDAWVATAEANDARDAAVDAGPRSEAIISADAIFDSVQGDPQSSHRATVAKIYGGAARKLAERAMNHEDNSSRETTARCFERAAQLASDKQTLRAEGMWLKHFHTQQLDRDWRRLRELADKLPPDDVLAKTLHAYVLYLGYVLEADPTQRRGDLKEAIELYDGLIPTDTKPGDIDAKLLLERGDAYLQLAHVAHRFRAQLQETNESVFGYLKAATKDAEIAHLDQPSKAIRIEALNLWGNATEDMSYYEVDAAPDGWRSHYGEAIKYFDQAFDEDQTAPLAPFNSGRCRFRLRQAELRNAPKAGVKDDATLSKAMNSMNAALANWDKSDNPKKAEAHYWLSKCQEELNKLQEADASRQAAVEMAVRLDDPVWQSYQLEWARLAMRRWREAAAAADKKKLSEQAHARAYQLLNQAEINDSQPADAVFRRVDMPIKAEAAGMLIQLASGIQGAIDTVEEQIANKKFAGDDAVNRACRAELNLALARRIMQSPRGNGAGGEFAQFKDRAEKFAENALEETSDKVNRQSQSYLRADAHSILGEILYLRANSDNDLAENIRLWNESRKHFLEGVNEIPDRPNLPFPLLCERLDNVKGLASLTKILRPPNETAAQYKLMVAEAQQRLDEVRIRLIALPPTTVIDGKPVTTRIEEVKFKHKELQDSLK